MRDPEDIGRLDAALGYAILRLTMGLDFLFHSYQGWLAPGVFVEGVVRDFAHTPLPAWSVRAFAVLIIVWEPAAGLLIVLGLWTRVGLVAGGLLMAALVFGTALRGDFAALTTQLVYALTFFVLLFFRSRHDRFGLDGLRSRR